MNPKLREILLMSKNVSFKPANEDNTALENQYLDDNMVTVNLNLKDSNPLHIVENFEGLGQSHFHRKSENDLLNEKVIRQFTDNAFKI